jgi:hypothetical protein
MMSEGEEDVLIIPGNWHSRMVLTKWKTNTDDEVGDCGTEICFEDLHAQLGDFESYYLSLKFDAFCEESPEPSASTNDRAYRLMQLLGNIDIPPVRGTVVFHLKPGAVNMEFLAKWVKEQNG